MKTLLIFLILLTNPALGFCDGFMTKQKVAISQEGLENRVSANITNASIPVTQSGVWTVTGASGTEYTEGDTDATITGGAIMWEDAADTLRPVSASKPLPVDITDASVAVTGTFFQATQPISGTVTANAGSGTFVVGDGAGALNVIVDSAPTITVTDGAGAMNTIIDSGSVSITGTPTVAISQTTTNNDVDANITNATLAVTQSGAWDEVGINDSGNSITIDGSVTASDPTFTDATGTVVPANAAFVGGTDGTNTRALKTDASGELQVDVLTMPTTTVTATNLDVQIGGSDSLTIGAFPDNEPFNVAQINGVAPSMGNGISGTGVQRVTIASDSTGQVAISGTPTVTVGTFPDNEPFNIAQMNGVAVSMGVGNTGTGTQRIVTATGGTATASQVADTATSTTILVANTSRRSASVSNDSSAVLYLLVGAGTASATNYTFRLAQYATAIIDSTSAVLVGVWATDPNDGGAKVTEIT